MKGEEKVASLFRGLRGGRRVRDESAADSARSLVVGTRGPEVFGAAAAQVETGQRTENRRKPRSVAK